MACNLNSTIKLSDCLKFQGSSAEQTYPDFATLLNHLLPNIYILAGLIIFFFIFLGGFTMIANAGNVEKQREGKQMITSAIIGFIVVVLSYLLIQIIEILTGIPILHSNL